MCSCVIIHLTAVYKYMVLLSDFGDCFDGPVITCVCGCQVGFPSTLPSKHVNLLSFFAPSVQISQQQFVETSGPTESPFFSLSLSSNYETLNSN